MKSALSKICGERFAGIIIWRERHGYNVIDFDRITSEWYVFSYSYEGEEYKFNVRVGTKFVVTKTAGGGYNLLPEETVEINN